MIDRLKFSYEVFQFILNAPETDEDEHEGTETKTIMIYCDPCSNLKKKKSVLWLGIISI